MVRNCVICEEAIEEDYGKLKGTMVRVRDENWLEKAKIKGV